MTDRNAQPPRPSGAGAADRASAGRIDIAPRFAVAVGLLTVIFAACFFYLRPEIATAQQRIADTNAAIEALQAQIDGLEARIAANLKLRAAYAALEMKGFLGEQNRLPAIRKLEELRHQHRITGLEYQILPAETLELARPLQPGVALIGSRIVLNMRGYLDRDLSSFVDAVAQDLPGHIAVVSLEINKLARPDARSLARMRQGKGADLVSGAAALQWRVARPLEQVTSP